jgi:hypothetical protein
MTNAMSKPIPKKQRPSKAFATPIIPLSPRATWVPEDKENQAGEKTRKIKLTLSTEPGNLNGKTLNKEFKIFRTGSPEEWILWRRDFNEVCVGMNITSGANHNRMVRQLLSDEPLKEFERLLATFATETVANCNRALDAVAVQIFPNNAYAKQKKYLRQGMWKPRALTIRSVYTRVCELNDQLLSYPNQTGALPVDELKSAFINLCLPEWQQEFLKTDINEYGSTWEEILSKAEALETAENAVAERAPAKRALEEGEVATATNPSPIKKAKKATDKSQGPFFCKIHGAGQGHNTYPPNGCKVVQGMIDGLKNEKQGFRKPNTQFSSQNNNQQNTKPTWTDRKRPATSYSTEQLKDIVRMTKKKVMQKAKTKFQAQLQDDLNTMEFEENNTQDRAKMHEMESFMNTLIEDSDESDMEGESELTQAELDELTASLSD